MKIVHYYPPALSGDFGTAIAVRGWCSAVAETGVEVVLAADSERAAVDPPPNVELIPAGTVRIGRLPLHLRSPLANADAVVLHGGWDARNLPVAWLARRLGVPYIVTSHGVYNPRVFGRGHTVAKRAWWPILERPYLQRALAVHVFFPEEVGHLTVRGVDTPVIVAPSGYAPPSNVVRRPHHQPFLLWLGRYDPENKGLDVLLDGVHLLPRGDRPRLRLVGVDWRARRQLVAQRVRNLGLQEHVTVEGPLHGDSKWEALSGARGFVYPSRWEAFGVAVAEAASIGVPTLVTPFPLGRFLASRNGAILRPPEAPALAEGIRRLMDQDADEIGARGAEVVREYLAWDRVASSWREQVEELLTTRDRY